MIYSIISFITDTVVNSFVSTSYQNIFICSLPFTYYLIKRKTIFFIITLIYGIIFDFLYSDIFLLNTYYFLLFGYFIHISGNYNSLKTITLSIIGTIMYDVYICFILIFTNYSVFKINHLYYKIEHSLIINLIYIIISVIILSRLLTPKTKKKRRKRA